MHIYERNTGANTVACLLADSSTWALLEKKSTDFIFDCLVKDVIGWTLHWRKNS